MQLPEFTAEAMNQCRSACETSPSSDLPMRDSHSVDCRNSVKAMFPDTLSFAGQGSEMQLEPVPIDRLEARRDSAA